MTVVKILEEWLREHGYDGLCSDECGCALGGGFWQRRKAGGET
uniref:Uncharacterized protein n=1 Tax=viral metagenome TaxID=1070528 RepID=A0A6M3IWN5_9ZZZZ